MGKWQRDGNMDGQIVNPKMVRRVDGRGSGWIDRNSACTDGLPRDTEPVVDIGAGRCCLLWAVEELNIKGVGEMIGWYHCQWTWTWAKTGRWWGTGRPGTLESMGSQKVGHDLATEQQRIFHLFFRKQKWIEGSWCLFKDLLLFETFKHENGLSSPLRIDGEAK